MTAQLLPLHTTTTTTTRPSSNANTRSHTPSSNTYDDPFDDPPNGGAINSHYMPSNTAKLQRQRQKNGGKKKSVRFTDVWDAGEREELFAVGDEEGESEEEEEDVPLAVRKGSLTARAGSEGRGIGNGSRTNGIESGGHGTGGGRQDIPKIYVTDS